MSELETGHSAMIEGAWRLVELLEDGDRFPSVVSVWCPAATAGCDMCLDYGSWVGEEDVEPCPDCNGGTPDYDVNEDGPWEREP